MGIINGLKLSKQHIAHLTIFDMYNMVCKRLLMFTMLTDWETLWTKQKIKIAYLNTSNNNKKQTWKLGLSFDWYFWGLNYKYRIVTLTRRHWIVLSCDPTCLSNERLIVYQTNLVSSPDPLFTIYVCSKVYNPNGTIRKCPIETVNWYE